MRQGQLYWPLDALVVGDRGNAEAESNDGSRFLSGQHGRWWYHSLRENLGRIRFGVK